jgi:hypothetical protein
MSSRIDGLKLRRTWGREEWHVPMSYGDGFMMVAKDQMASIIANVIDHEVGSIVCQMCNGSGQVVGSTLGCTSCRGSGKRPLFQEWVHASMNRVERMPDYDDLVKLHRSVWGRNGWSYQYFVPESKHVNLKAHALHLWGRLDGQPVLPDFVTLLGDGVSL